MKRLVGSVYKVFAIQKLKNRVQTPELMEIPDMLLHIWNPSTSLVRRDLCELKGQLDWLTQQ